MTTYFVTRHPGAVEWARESGISVDRQLAHLDIAEVKAGDWVIGTLPVHLAAEVCALGARYFHLALEIRRNGAGANSRPRTLGGSAPASRNTGSLQSDLPGKKTLRCALGSSD
jgi:CRISPR-associated protein Csx16